jgi:serralysin
MKVTFHQGNTDNFWRYAMSLHHVNQRMTATALAFGLGLAAPIVLTTKATAAPTEAVVTVSNTRLTYTAAAGQTNKLNLAISQADGHITYLIDDSVPISNGSGCTYPDNTDRTRISCTLVEFDSASPYYSGQLFLGDGNDTVSIANSTNQAFYDTVIDLGPGKDISTSTGTYDGTDVTGGTGNDTFTVGPQGHADGNDGNDVFWTSGYFASADGGKGNDEMHGGVSTQSLRGDDGNDTISGGGSTDFIRGGRGNDRLYGGKGNDEIYGNSGNDRLYGNDGNDLLSGGPGTDQVDGGAGKDTVTS